jgi:hypothetical protein
LSESKGLGFSTRDSHLERWLQSLIQEIEDLSSRESWQDSLLEHWPVQATIDGGVMSVSFNESLTDDIRREFMLSMAQAALNRSGPLGRRTGELFIRLLQGKLTTTVTSPVDYLDTKT